MPIDRHASPPPDTVPAPIAPLAAPAMVDAPADDASGDVASGDVMSGDVVSGDVASGDVASGGVAADAVATNAPLAAHAPASSSSPVETTLVTTSEATTSARGWQTLAWLSALALVLAGWWGARRHTRRLAAESADLIRQQRRLQHAHAHLQSQSEKLRAQSILDPLTGILNRQAFATELRELTEHIARFGRPLNLIVFDLDHFKRINDRHGHLAGDAALKLVVGIVREHLVSEDLFGRFGGDEFLIACADQPLASCCALAESIRCAVETRAAGHQPSLPGLSLSMGVAQADRDSGYVAAELFARADAALYEAKRLGRNRVVVADADLPQVPALEHANRHL
jgi:diguanylate cyclase (GGDEF)-like protein